MGKVTVNMALSGVAQLTRALELTDTETQVRTRRALEKGAQAVARGAEQRAPKVSGELAQSIRAEEGKGGRVWFVKAGYGKLLRSSKAKTAAGLRRYEKVRERHAAQRARFRAAKSSKQALANLQLGVYAPVVERGDGDRNIKPQPFLYPALDNERTGIMHDVKNAPIDAGRRNGL